MAITNYVELQAAIAGWLNRDDLAARIPEFIALAEARINRRLRVQRMLTAANFIVDAERVDLPEDWLQTETLSYEDQHEPPLEYLTPLAFLRKRASATTAGKPRYWTLEGRQKRFLPAPDAVYQMWLNYYVRIPPLDDVNEPNWLLTEHADLYLSASLLAANTYLRDVEGVQLATAEMADIIAAMELADSSDRVNTTPVMRAQPIG